MNEHGKRHPRARLALLAGVGIVVLYLAGAAVSGRASILARRPLLDGLAPPTPYRWVTAPGPGRRNKSPASTRFTLELTPDGSRLGAFSTSDGQINLVLSEGAVPARPGQTGVEVAVDPVDPATLGPVPPGLVSAGNAYRIQASYQPSGARSRPSAASPASAWSTRCWPPPWPTRAARGAVVGRRARLGGPPGTDTPGTHQVSAGLTRTGYSWSGCRRQPAGRATTPATGSCCSAPGSRS